MPTLGGGGAGVCDDLGKKPVAIRAHIYLSLGLTVQTETQPMGGLLAAQITHSHYLVHGATLHNSKPDVGIWIAEDIGSDEAVVQLLHLQVHPQVLAGVLLRLVAEHGGHAEDGRLLPFYPTEVL